MTLTRGFVADPEKRGMLYAGTELQCILPMMMVVAGIPASAPTLPIVSINGSCH